MAGVLMRHSALPRVLDALPSILLQPLFVLIDAIGRTQGVCLFGVQSVLSHPDRAIAASPLAMVLIGTIVGAGGDVCVPSSVALTSQVPSDVQRLLEQLVATTTTVGARSALARSVDLLGAPALLALLTAQVVAIVYAALVDAHPLFSPLRSWLVAASPSYAEPDRVCTVIMGVLLGVGRLRAALRRPSAVKTKRA